MTITSDPPGALVLISNVEKGRTPLEMTFTWYGDYDIMLQREGCQTLKTHANLVPPWYEIPPVDLLSEIAPWTYRDHRYLHYVLPKQVIRTDEQLLQSAEVLKERNLEPVKK